MRLRLRAGLGILLIGASVGLVAQNPPPDNSARSQLYQFIDGLAHTDITARSSAIARISTRQDAERRRTATREKLRRLIGGLPEHSGRVAVKEFGSVAADGFNVEKIAYESLPGFWVTANVYRPSSGQRPFPAIVLAPGHGAGGKTENWSWGANFARNGIIVLA